MAVEPDLLIRGVCNLCLIPTNPQINNQHHLLRATPRPIPSNHPNALSLVHLDLNGHAPMASKRKKHSKGKAADRPDAIPDPSSSHIQGEVDDLPKVPFNLQQTILNIFTDALPISTDSNLRQTIQDVKGHLFNRDFSAAFGTDSFLHAYALRWSACRALAYADIFAGLNLNQIFLKNSNENEHGLTEDRHGGQILCLGGGAGAEVVALAIMAAMSPYLRELSITAIDIADWSSVLGKLIGALPTLFQHSSATNRDTNRVPPLDPATLHVNFRMHDILECSVDELGALVADVCLVTVMFTLNELFSASTAKTTALLLNLTDIMKPGSWLLVVDSPGSYSEVALGQTSTRRTYPMNWLLDHTLQQMAGKEADGRNKWRKHMTNNSVWFRNNRKLKYCLDLENMRYQIHLYQRQPKANCSSDDMIKGEKAVA